MTGLENKDDIGISDILRSSRQINRDKLAEKSIRQEKISRETKGEKLQQTFGKQSKNVKQNNHGRNGDSLGDRMVHLHKTRISL